VFYRKRGDVQDVQTVLEVQVAHEEEQLVHYVDELKVPLGQPVIQFDW